jgi:hypothetical protein
MYEKGYFELEHKILYNQTLIKEFQYVSEIFKTGNLEFFKHFKFKPLSKSELDLNSISKPTKIPKLLKSLYKELCKIVHPDVYGSDLFFTPIQQAYTDKKLTSLLFYAYILQFDLSSYNTSVIHKLIQKENSELESKIKNIKSSVGWMWYNSNKEKRLAIENVLVKNFELERL